MPAVRARDATAPKKPYSKKTAQERVLQYPADFRIDPGRPNELWCKFCDHTVNHDRPKTIKEHRDSQKHAANKQRKLAQGDGARVQATLNWMSKSTEERDTITKDFVAICTQVGLPLFTATKFLPFMRKHARQGGAIPNDESTLRRHHLPRVFEGHQRDLRARLKDKKVVVVIDETTDERDKSVLNIIIGKQ